MPIPRLRHALAALAALSSALVLAGASAAQSDGLSLHPPNPCAPPDFLGTYEVATQAIIGAPLPDGVVALENIATEMPGWAFFPPNPCNVAMDWASLGTAADASGAPVTVFGLQIGYATASRGPVALTVRLHAGATGYGDPGTVVAAIPLTGLPGSADGRAAAHVLDVLLETPVVLPFGHVGWSYQASDAMTGPMLAIPSPGPPDLENAFDLYDSCGDDLVYLDTGWCGGEPYASFYMRLIAEPAECYLVVGDAPGADALASLGHVFTTQVAGVQASWAVLMEDIPEFPAPPPVPAPHAPGAVLGGKVKLKPAPLGAPGGGRLPVAPSPVYPEWMGPDGEACVQIVLWNPQVFPAQPEQFSYGLRVRMLPDGSIVGEPYGTGTGIDVWVETGLDADGQPVVRFPFSIPGF